jgi:hypothetical protein
MMYQSIHGGIHFDKYPKYNTHEKPVLKIVKLI